MKEWFVVFWKNNGTRLVYGSVATVFALAFYLYFEEMKGEAKTILIGVAMQCYNKMRSEPKQRENA